MESRVSRLGPFGIAVAIFVLISVALSLIYCAFPWGMTHYFRQMK